MAKRTIQFVLSEETDLRYEEAIQQVEDLKAQGWEVTDLSRTELNQGGELVPVAEIELTKRV